MTSDIDRLTDRRADLVAAVTIPIFAEHVPPALTGDRRRRSARCARCGATTTGCCASRSARGAPALDGDRASTSPGFHVEAVDTTGAGDVFRAGFIHGRLSGWPLERTLRFANAAAAVSCTRLGALAGVPSLADVDAMLAREPGSTTSSRQVSNLPGRRSSRTRPPYPITASRVRRRAGFSRRSWDGRPASSWPSC